MHCPQSDRTNQQEESLCS